jgi:multiple sugar transport system ATP-binding protein
MSEVRLLNVTKKFKEVTAVDQINLTVKDKEFLVLVGPSGCGKSTTLRMIAGLEEVSEGEIYIDKRMVNEIPPKDRDIAMVFQNYALYPHMNVYKNMSFGLRLRKLRRDKIEVRVQETARILGIEELLKRKPKELSGGQRQRVAMGRAIVRKPHVFLFDEPLSNLDAKLRVQMRGELAKLHERLETTIIYVTHDQIEAMTLASRIVIMNQGNIVRIGSPMEVYNEPKNLFVAGFIGSPAMNFIEGHIIEENGSLLIIAEGNRLAIPKQLQDRYAKGKDRKMILGIRPEHIYDSALKGPFPGSERVPATVEVIEPIGSEVILLSTFGSVHLTSRVDPLTKAKPHTPIEFLIDMNKVHLFDKDTGIAY